VAGKPAVITEWNSVWPNQWRAADTAMVPAYGLLNDLAIIYIYCYMGGWGLGPDNVKPKIHHGTVIFSDPAETGLFPALALMYRRGDVSPARNVVEMGISGVDMYLAGKMFTCDGDFQHFVPLICRWQSKLFDQRYRPSPGVSLTVSSGFSATGDYRAARRLLLWVGPAWRDGRGTELFNSARLFHAGLRPAGKPDQLLMLRGELPAGASLAVAVPASATIDAASAAGWRRWLEGTADGRRVCLGIERRSGRKAVSLAPGAGQAVRSSPDLLARWFTEACRRWGLLRPGHGYNPETGEIVSDTGELRWRPREGIWTCAAERACIVAGFVGGRRISAGALTVQARTRFGVYLLVSLDGAPIRRSRHMLLIAVGRAENTGQKLKELVFVEPGRPPERLGRVQVVDVGREPVLVQGLEAQIDIRSEVRQPWQCWALTAAGKRARQVRVHQRRGYVALRPSPRFKTIYYELVAR